MVCLLLTLALAPIGAGEDRGNGLSPALKLFLDARLAETSGEYRAALDLYEKALECAPENVEIRISYAALLNQAGMAGKAVGLLEGRSDLDWYGQRTLALILSRMAARQPEYLAPAESSLRDVLEQRPEDPNVQLSLAQVLLMLNRPEEAEPIVRELRQGRKHDVRLIELHGRLLEMLDRNEEAVELLQRCAASSSTGERCRSRLLRLLENIGRRGEAGQLLLQWSGDENVEDQVRAGSLLLEGGRPDEALRAAGSVLAADGDNAPARRLKASALAELGRLDEAIRTLRSLLRDDPKDAESRLLLAWWLGRMDRLQEAREHLQRVWASVRDGDSPSLVVHCCLTAARLELAADNVTAAREWLGRIDKPADAGPELPRLLAETYRRRESWRDGVGALLRLQPRLGGDGRLVAVALEAELRLRAGDTRGIDRLEDVARAGLRGAELAVQVLQTVGLWEQAERFAAEALTEYPGETTLLFARGAALERSGREEEAVPVFQKVLEIEPRNAAAANYLGYMWAESGVRLEEALELIRTAVEVRPNEGAYLDSLGWVHYKLGNLEEAERWLRRAVSQNPSDGTVFAHLGEVLLELGHTDEAREMLQRGLNYGCDEPERVRRLLDSMNADGP